MYLESVLKGYKLMPVPENPELRNRLANHSLEELTEMLSQYKALHNSTDVDTVKRAIRAIEIEEYYAAHPVPTSKRKYIFFPADWSAPRSSPKSPQVFGIRLLKRNQAVGLPAIFPDLFHQILIGAKCLRHRIFCCRPRGPRFPVQKNRHRLIDLRIVAIPAQPTMLHRIKPAADRSCGRHRSRGNTAE